MRDLEFKYKSQNVDGLIQNQISLTKFIIMLEEIIIRKVEMEALGHLLNKNLVLKTDKVYLPYGVNLLYK